MASRMETVVNITILVTCAVVLASLGLQIVAAPRSQTPRQTNDVLTVGHQFPAFEAIKADQTDRTLVLIGKAECRFCRESAPFYRRVATLLKDERPTRTQLVMVTSDSAEVASEFVKREGLILDRVVNLTTQQRGQLRIRGTPTLYLVDRSGRILREWIGRLDNAGEQDVLSVLATSAVNPDRSNRP